MPGNPPKGKYTRRRSDPPNDDDLVLHWKREPGTKPRNDSEPDPDFDPVLLSQTISKNRNNAKAKQPSSSDEEVAVASPIASNVAVVPARGEEPASSCCCFPCGTKKKKPVTSGTNVTRRPSVDPTLHVNSTLESTNMHKKHKN